ncbi:deoxyguanosinetriphosphate triphosphohydrolase [Embleya hyalina]|uniref:deoxyguanosinetriphosphate triphosphohydrolase n=1 Tax=Embleya hyalina TaxID=516124 RepID=UPI000F82E0A1|nr:deoxyguanosinetriphosphate triphosphohydrolase [Embleya hyalina]
MDSTSADAATPRSVPRRYGPDDLARWVPEPNKRRGRTAFQRDRARVLHSAALRRLAGKTQVVTPGESTPAGQDSPRTRLTHSLECAQIGRELGQALGCDPDLVETACLAHDLGHPPFGHNGERALDEAAKSCGGFEGNAQSLRLLTRLEPKTFGPDGRSVGLNLTRAGLDAVLKYPWPRREDKHAYGAYDDDRAVFDWVRAGADPSRRCLEAQVMDWSDDVAYSVHDLEDAVQSHRLDLVRLRDAGERRELLDLTVRRYRPDCVADELGEALDRLLALDFWPAGYDGSRRAQARLKNATSGLIGRFCLAAEHATRELYGTAPALRYAADLIVPREIRLECAVLKAVTARYVMAREGAEQLRERQRTVLTELVELLAAGAPERLDASLRDDWIEADTDAARLRVVIDQVASLTDRAALTLHATLTTR